METNELLSLMQAEFNRLHDRLDRIDDGFNNRLDGIEDRVLHTEERTSLIIGGAKVVSLLATIGAAVGALFKWGGGNS
jgi:tetrahydromethanopterin S-methyltransferase subunit G